ncbi:class I SAM-dependent methyltransferase [Solihabitans fulvus]|uniref:Class I SAM-dependent methyltransferase n=1 Tax=Solihabitans fulvus TaxID=1892852 RepID=A0A5B2X0G2_9PSEU|nr:class I SAM-dependent methyltransferase [Solihabitans fulvus]KAA2256349.1 class I SAM-dependent methyltransferase [Solihabitans fulvus]
MTLAGDDVLVADLLDIAERSDAEASAAIAGLDPERVAVAVLREIAARARLRPEPPDPVTVALDLGFADRRLGFAITLGAGKAEVAVGGDAEAPVLIRQNLVELLRAVFGPAGRHDASRELVVEHVPGPGAAEADAANRRVSLGVLAANQLVGAVSGRPADLTELAVRFQSDKWGSHWYTPNYERYFAPYRDARVKILEIGIGGYGDPQAGGASLRMWKHYFRRGLVYGMDIHEKTGIDEPRLRTIVGDQSDAALLDSLGASLGPFDIIIDDGSHLNEHVITSFHALFPHVRPGGLYVIEDTQTSYWPGWGGSSTELDRPDTSMNLVKSLVDGLNHREFVRNGDAEPSATDLAVTSVHVHHNMAVIEKGVNTEQSAPPWIPRTEDEMTAFRAP